MEAMSVLVIEPPVCQTFLHPLAQALPPKCNFLGRCLQTALVARGDREWVVVAEHKDEKESEEEGGGDGDAQVGAELVLLEEGEPLGIIGEELRRWVIVVVVL